MNYTLQQAFLHPDDEFSPLPFWFWNDTLTNAELTRQIEDFHAHGVAGFVIHPRKGLPLSIPYMGEAYLAFVRHAVEEAARLHMRVVLYDEGMYPSGAAHGMVVAENAAWASRCLWMARHDAPVPAAEDIVAVCAAHVAQGRVSGVTPVSLREGVYPLPGDGRTLLAFREGFSGGTIRGIHENEDDGESHAPRSADLLNPEAVQAFIRLTHERYYAALAPHFGRTIIAMFTDEPDIVGRNARKGAIAWTRGFLAEFGDAADLPALFLDAENGEAVRRRYRRAVNGRMLRTYYRPLADWCGAHGVSLTGHPAKGWDIGLLAPFQLPAQDLVWRYIAPGRGITGEESVMGRCSADAARHHGRRRNGNECFGCCGPEVSQWAMKAADMKWMMDYLFVRGVNQLYPHAFYYSTRDGRGDERPPDVGPNNTWWPEYAAVAAYMRRLSWLMTDSVDQSRVAVLCEEDRMPWQCCIPLYEGQVGFHYLPLDLLPRCRVDDGALSIGQARYTHVIAEASLPEDAALAAFRAQGGQVLRGAEGDLPRDAVIMPAAPDLRTAHVVKGGVHFLLLVNEGEGCIDGRLRPPVDGAAQWWDAWTGRMWDAHPWEGAYPLHLAPRESLILAIDEFRPALAEVEPACLPDAVPLAVSCWRLTRADGETAILMADTDGRCPGWETLPGWETWSGWVAYEADVTIDPAHPRIDLGEVYEMVRVYANGQHIGTRLWGPYVFDLPAGAVHLRVEVANTPAGRMDGAVLPSGLLGGEWREMGE